jgi:hypothetical protein
MAIFGLLGGLILCGAVIAGLRGMKHTNDTVRINNMKIQ